MRRASLLLAVIAALAAAPATASAKDPGRWIVTGATSVPNDYFQGLTSNPAGSSVWFTGFFAGPLEDHARLRRTAGAPVAVPPAVVAARRATTTSATPPGTGRGRPRAAPAGVLQPEPGGNTCGTGAFGVADPETLAWRYYVKLDPAEIPKAMWAETSPDGKLIWTSSGDDLLAYRSSDVDARPTRPRWPADPLGAPARRRRAAVGHHRRGVRGRPAAAGGRGRGHYQIWSVGHEDGKAPTRVPDEDRAARPRASTSSGRSAASSTG